MRTVFTTIVTLMLVKTVFAACATPDAPPAPRPLRFVTFNMLHGGMLSELWGDGEKLDARLDAAADSLRALDADVIGLQEASRGWRRGNVSARLASMLGFEVVDAGATSRLFGGHLLGPLAAFVLRLDEGPAIVSRYPITRTTVALLDQCGAFYRRVLLCAEVCTPWGPVEACSTHLNGSECQAESVDAELRSRPGDVPVVLMGDLNATEDTPALSTLREGGGFVDTFRAVNPTLPGYTDDQELDTPRATAGERVDYVLLAPGAGGRGDVVASHVVLDRPFSEDGDVRWASDHYGVLSDVALFGAFGTAGRNPALGAARAPSSQRAVTARAPRRPPA